MEEKKFLITPITNGELVGAHNLNYAQSEPDVATVDDNASSKCDGDIASPTDDDGGGGVARSRTPSVPSQFPYPNIPLIYSEPALFSLGQYSSAAPLIAISDTALPNIYLNRRNDSGIASSATVNEEDKNEPATPKSSMYMSDMSFVGRHGHKPSFSTREIREQHARMQQKYRDDTKRERRFTDPVDFEGILNIIGGCSFWQIWVYSLIAFQQIPHAMFNLNVVYMMYDPEHHCQVPGFNDTNITVDPSAPFLWGYEDVKNFSFVFPSKDDASPYSMDTCKYYQRSEERYRELRRMPLEKARDEAWKDTAHKAECTSYIYSSDIMRETLVTDYHLVCKDYLRKGHAHLFYSFGYLVGCMVGGVASDSFGRKPTIIGFGILSSLLGMFLPFVEYYPMFLFLRFLSAICNEAADLAAYTLCMEITGTRYRAMVGSMLQVPWAVGYALLALIAYLTKSWKTIQVIAGGFHFLAVLLICSIPESPRWLIVKERVSEAEEVIRRACRDPPFPFNMCRTKCGNLPSDLELVCHREKKINTKGKITIMELFTMKELRFRTMAVCVVFMATALVYYGLVMALSDQSAPGRVLFTGYYHLNNGIAGFIEIPTLFFCVYLMKLGRKKALMLTLLAAGIVILIGMFAVISKHYMIALSLMLLGKICVQGAFNILYIFTSELYPTVCRNTAVGVTSMVARFGSGISSYIALLSNISLPIVPMIIFAIFSLFASILVLVLPETGEKPLPETLDDAITQPETRVHCMYGFMFRGVGRLTRSISLTENPTSDFDNEGSRRPSSAIRRNVMSPVPPVVYSRNTSRADSIFAELADLQLPEKLPEAFDE
ncbi:unnamed protein product [Caenorhabditis auriculariae]|uniref:Major facilitator superfamily (MFS) profile domain-containing protein n=1 Tax=Caenorhabditis auriculariae TaxID=2777116 RepID=A0A8S1HKI3_9PELO|nr:unnamed protein product [Caenorhabditis auriculariae]